MADAETERICQRIRAAGNAVMAQELLYAEALRVFVAATGELIDILVARTDTETAQFNGD